MCDVIYNEAVPFRPYCAGVATRTRNVSEYILVLALCLVIDSFQCSGNYGVISNNEVGTLVTFGTASRADCTAARSARSLSVIIKPVSNSYLPRTRNVSINELRFDGESISLQKRSDLCNNQNSVEHFH